MKEELTKEEWKILDDVCEEYLAYGLSCEPADRGSVEDVMSFFC